MRLYRFKNEDNNIDVVVVTDGSCDQKRIFITESPRGIVIPGSINPSADEKAGSDAFLALGWKWNVGETVMHEELVEFAENNDLKLTIYPEGLNEIVSVDAIWDADDQCVLTVKTTIRQQKEIEVFFPNTVTLNESVKRYGEIRGDLKTLAGKVMSSWVFTLEDLGLAAKKDLNLVIMADGGVQKFELTAKSA